MQEPFHAIDITMNEVKSDGTAYYRLPDDFYNFLVKCQEENRIIGFAFEGTRNFGIILQKKLITKEPVKKAKKK